MSPNREQDNRPRRLVDETGDVAEVERLLAEVADHGEVVLAGPRLPTDATIDLYRDLHVRGLTLTTGERGDEPSA
jgi:hypothetical protein